MNFWRACFDDLTLVFTKDKMSPKEAIQQVAEHLSIAFTQNHSSETTKCFNDHKRCGTFSDFMEGKSVVKNQLNLDNPNEQN